MDSKELAKLTGQEGGERVVAYKLNEIRMSGNDGTFTYLELLGTKGEDNKYPSKEIGKTLNGVILKMRWRLFKYEEVNGIADIKSTSEYDNKNTDQVYLFGKGEKGLAVDIKEKYKLGTQRVLYVYLPKKDEIVRIMVKPSALTADNNPNKEMGLFEYVDSFRNDSSYLHEHLTNFSGVERKDPKNPRKDYFAMTFSRGAHLLPESIEKVAGLIKEVHERTTGTDFVEEYVPPAEDTGEVDADLIPF
jgi:hypothetical protein